MVNGQLRPPPRPKPPPLSRSSSRQLSIRSQFILPPQTLSYSTSVQRLPRGVQRGRGPLPLSIPSPIVTHFMEFLGNLSLPAARNLAVRSTIPETTIKPPMLRPPPLTLPPPLLSPSTTPRIPIINVTNGNPMCKQADMDICSQKMLMVTDRNFHYPITMEEMNKRCRELKSLEKCVTHYSQHCFKSIIQQKSFSLIIYGVTKTNRKICRNRSRRHTFVEFGKQCANRLQHTMIGFVEDMYQRMFSILKYPIRKLSLPLSCCNYYVFKNRALQMYEQQCPQHSNQMNRLLQGFTKDSFTFICSQYQDKSERCNRIMDRFLQYQNMTNLVQKNSPLKLSSTESFITTYINMIHSLGS